MEWLGAGRGGGDGTARSQPLEPALLEDRYISTGSISPLAINSFTVLFSNSATVALQNHSIAGRKEPPPYRLGLRKIAGLLKGPCNIKEE
jgi:hypothetical protein